MRTEQTFCLRSFLNIETLPRAKKHRTQPFLQRVVTLQTINSICNSSVVVSISQENGEVSRSNCSSISLK